MMEADLSLLQWNENNRRIKKVNS